MGRRMKPSLETAAVTDARLDDYRRIRSAMPALAWGLTAEDMAEAVAWVTAQPPHVNVNVVELMPTTQSFAPFQVHRG